MAHGGRQMQRQSTSGRHQIRIDQDRVDPPLLARLEVVHTSGTGLALGRLADIVVGHQVRRDDDIARQEVGTVSARAAVVEDSSRRIAANDELCPGRGANHAHATRDQDQRLVAQPTHIRAVAGVPILGDSFG